MIKSFKLYVLPDYNGVSIVLTNGYMYEQCMLDKREASKLLIPTIMNLLQKHEIVLNELSLVLANEGPAPFTTLRTALISLNGLLYNSLVDRAVINGGQVFAHLYPTAWIIINAFGGFVHLIPPHSVIHKDAIICCTTQEAALHISDYINQDQVAHLIGNGVDFVRPCISESNSTRVVMLSDVPSYPTPELVLDAIKQNPMLIQKVERFVPWYNKPASTVLIPRESK